MVLCYLRLQRPGQDSVGPSKSARTDEVWKERAGRAGRAGHRCPGMPGVLLAAALASEEGDLQRPDQYASSAWSSQSLWDLLNSTCCRNLGDLREATAPVHNFFGLQQFLPGVQGYSRSRSVQPQLGEACLRDQQSISSSGLFYCDCRIRT